MPTLAEFGKLQLQIFMRALRPRPLCVIFCEEVEAVRAENSCYSYAAPFLNKRRCKDF